MMQEEIIDLVRKYLANQLPPEEKAAFEQRLAADPAFAAAAAETATVFKALVAAGDRELEEKLMALSKELNQMNASALTPNRTSVNIRAMTSYSRIIYAAAVLVGLLVIVLPLWLMNRPDGAAPDAPEDIYAANFTIPPAPEARSEESSAAKWRQAFAQGDYKTSVAQLEGLLADTTFTGRSEASLYLGIAQLALDNPGAALQALRQVNSDSFDWESAQWYSALALLKSNRIEEAKQVFRRIAGQNAHPHHNEAKKILSEL
ncbi:MAG: hypothetical protein IPM81_17795 [Saprospirales bacterium]|nr:hypothetical protein [Saprospirales bacterium]